MRNLIKTCRAFGSDVRGVTALEYGLIAAVIAGVSATVFTGIGTHLNTVLTTVNNAI